MAQERASALADLLANMFSEPELRTMLASVGDHELLAALPPSVPLATLAHEAVAALGRRGTIDRELFARLLALRPRREADITAVQALWDDELAAPAKLADKDKAPAPRTLAGTPAYLRPEGRETAGGLRLVDVRPGPRPALRFTLKNESNCSLTLTSVVLDAVCHESWMLLSPPRPIAPTPRRGAHDSESRACGRRPGARRKLVPLARHVGAALSRGDYLALSRSGFGTFDAIASAADDALLGVLGSAAKVALIREAHRAHLGGKTAAAARARAEAILPAVEMLEG